MGMPHNRCMSQSADAAATGLRERKKIRTRAAIRDNAMRLFTQQGYTATTIDQIAEAADISPSTFFRYFPTKEAVVLADDLDLIIIAALEAVPPDVPPLAAVRQGLTGALSRLSEHVVKFEMERQQLIANEPELHATMLDDFRRNVDLIATVVAGRTGRPAESFEIRVFAGAVIGALLAAAKVGLADGSERQGFGYDVDGALRLLEQGLPL